MYKRIHVGLGLELSRLEFQVPQSLLLGKHDTTSGRNSQKLAHY